MVHISVIEARLSQLEVRISSLFKPEIRELQQILMDGEEIVAVVPGRYFGGFALLAATERRLILIDKKIAVLATEVIPYDMISEVDFGARMLDATLVLFTVNKQHRFTSFKHRQKLRELTTYVQQRVMELRYGNSAPQVALPAQAQPEPAQALALAPAPEPLPSPSYQSDQAAQYLPAVAFAQHSGHHIAMPTYLSRSLHHMPKLVGAAALHNTPWSSVNPYTRTSLTIRNQWSRVTPSQ